MHYCISIAAAAELCSVGEPAIRRAFREGRIKPAGFWHIGRSHVGTYLNLASVVAAYTPDAARIDELIEKWVAHAAIVHTEDGEQWAIVDQSPPLMFREGSARAEWVIDR